MRGPHPPLPQFGFLDAAGGLGGGGGGGGDNPRRRRLPSTHAVEANPVFPGDEDPDTNHGDRSDPVSAAFAGAVPSRKKKKERGENLVPCGCPVCGKGFSHAKALHGHMRCHPDRTWRGITPPGSEEEVAASLARLSSGEGARARRYVCSRCGSGFETRQGLGGHRASHKSVQGCHARSLEGGGRKLGSGAHIVRRGGGDEGGKPTRTGQKRRGRWRASKEAETAEAAAQRRGLLPDLNLPVPLEEDTEDGSSSGVIHLNEKLPGQDKRFGEI